MPLGKILFLLYILASFACAVSYPVLATRFSDARRPRFVAESVGFYQAIATAGLALIVWALLDGHGFITVMGTIEIWATLLWMGPAPIILVGGCWAYLFLSPIFLAEWFSEDYLRLRQAAFRENKETRIAP